MKEKILEIIDSKCETGGYVYDVAAEEITAMVFEFVGWIGTNERFLFQIDRDIDGNVLSWGFGDFERYNDLNIYDTEYIFNYWLTNIYKK